MSEMKKRQRREPTDVPILCEQTGQIFKNRRECIMITNVPSGYLTQILRGEKRNYKGLSFKYVTFSE